MYNIVEQWNNGSAPEVASMEDTKNKLRKGWQGHEGVAYDESKIVECSLPHPLT